MHPRRQNAGLPSTPRSRSLGRTLPVDPPRNSSPHHHARQQHSESRSAPRSRSRPPASESSRSLARYAPSSSARSEAGGPSRRSDGSTASSGSSLFDRGRSGRGYESSRTSLEDDRMDHRKKRAPPLNLSMRSRRVARSERAPSPHYDDSDPEITSAKSTGDAANIWGRVATAASSLTVSVSKAWAANVSTFAGEETPVGGESRLTRAMKAYHAEKASSPTDLPAWLFDEHERRPVIKSPSSHKSWSSRRYDDEYDEEPSARPRGLRDIYEKAAANNASAGVSTRSGEVKSPTKATDRLKALRDAKRSAFTSVGTVEQGGEIPQAETQRETRQKRRVGLPSGPRAF